jgi:hypothetical protein
VLQTAHRAGVRQPQAIDENWDGSANKGVPGGGSPPGDPPELLSRSSPRTRGAMESPAATAPAADPLRATFFAILKQLNRADFHNEGDAADQALELPELERRLSEFWAVRSGEARIAVALGLLLSNGFVATDGTPEYSWQRGRTVERRYRITSEGKQFLLTGIETSDRVG